MSVQRLLARKYAQAFLGVAGNDLSLDTIQTVASLAQALKVTKSEMQRVFAVVPESAQRTVCENIVAQAKLPASFADLIRLLSEDKRLILLFLVFEQLVKLYKERARVMSYTITSSHPLDDAKRAAVKQFLARSTGYVIMDEYEVDKNLIAGIRMRSDTLLWEYSIDKQLKAIARLPGRGSYGN